MKKEEKQLFKVLYIYRRWLYGRGYIQSDRYFAKYNYFKTESSYISVYIYSDRIEIVSPGSLYSSNKLEKLKTASYLEVRNPTIINWITLKIDTREYQLWKEKWKNKDFPLQNFMMKEIVSRLF